MRREYDMSDRSQSGAGGRGSSAKRTPESQRQRTSPPEFSDRDFSYPEEFDDQFFDVPDIASTPREQNASSRRVTIPPAEPAATPRRPRGARQMPKRLSEELVEMDEEAVPEPAEDEIAKPQRQARRKYTRGAKDQGEQIRLDLKDSRKKQSTEVKQRQVLGVLLIMTAVLISLAIVSYSQLDTAQAETPVGDLPSIFTRANPQVNANADTAHNWLGLIGAMIADFFINKTIGYASIIFPVLLGAWSLALFRFKTKQRHKLAVATSFIIISAVLFSATIGTTQLINALPSLEREWAGAIGQFLGLTFTRLIGSIGSLIIFATSFLVMLIFAIDLDVERTFLRAKSGYSGLHGSARLKLVEFWDKREAKRAEKARLREQEELEEEIASAKAAEEEAVVIVKEKMAKQTLPKDELRAADVVPIITPPMYREEETEPARDIISINRDSAAAQIEIKKPEQQQEARSPFLKVRPAPKTNGAAPAQPVIARISRGDEQMLGGKSSQLARLSGGATGIPTAKRSLRILPADLEKDETDTAAPKVDTSVSAQVVETPKQETAADTREMIRLTIPDEETRVIKADEASIENVEPPVTIGDEKVLADEALPHSLASDEPPYRDVVREHQGASKQMAREIKEAKVESDPDTLFDKPKSFVPENPYQESLSKFRGPSLEILAPSDSDEEIDTDNEELTAKGTLLRDKLATFGIEIENITVTPGPVVTLYEFTPAEGVKVSAVSTRSDDIALAMKARGIRIIAPMPGRGTIGIEIPNDHPKMVRMRSALASTVFQNSKMNLPVALGKTISGDVYVDDLSKMPHLLIAGATGSGKSVGVNGIITSLLYAKNPRDVKFVVVDPKKIELSLYKALRNHFLIVSPEAGGEEIVTTPQYAVLALKALEIEMEKRYDKLAKAAVRSLADYNLKVSQGKLRSTSAEEQHYHLPYIVVIIDELADLMITAGREIEEPICRLAQMARAVGIHLILATQRPSVDVITGVIKANFPARIAFQVATKVDSRTILDTMGAEQLLGNGDMLYLPSGTPKPIRLQSPFISTEEVEAVVESIAEQQGQGMSYTRPWTLPSLKQKDGINAGGGDEDRDELFDDAAWLCFRHQQASTSMLQRRLSIGYSRAARIIDDLERYGIVSSSSGAKGREVLIDNEDEMELVIRNL